MAKYSLNDKKAAFAELLTKYPKLIAAGGLTATFLGVLGRYSVSPSEAVSIAASIVRSALRM